MSDRKESAREHADRLSKILYEPPEEIGEEDIDQLAEAEKFLRSVANYGLGCGERDAFVIIQYQGCKTVHGPYSREEARDTFARLHSQGYEVFLGLAPPPSDADAWKPPKPDGDEDPLEGWETTRDGGMNDLASADPDQSEAPSR